MTTLWQVCKQSSPAQRKGLLRGATLGLGGIGLFILSCWFITTAAATDPAATGAVFDVARRVLCLQRLSTHDVTLHALATLRVGLRHACTAALCDRRIRLRGPQILSRLTADIGPLGGMPRRLIRPLFAGKPGHR